MTNEPPEAQNNVNLLEGETIHVRLLYGDDGEPPPVISVQLPLQHIIAPPIERQNNLDNVHLPHEESDEQENTTVATQPLQLENSPRNQQQSSPWQNFINPLYWSQNFSDPEFWRIFGEEAYRPYVEFPFTIRPIEILSSLLFLACILKFNPSSTLATSQVDFQPPPSSSNTLAFSAGLSGITSTTTATTISSVGFWEVFKYAIGAELLCLTLLLVGKAIKDSLRSQENNLNPENRNNARL